MGFWLTVLANMVAIVVVFAVVIGACCLWCRLSPDLEPPDDYYSE